MTDGDRPKTLRRVRRAKQDGSSSPRFDGGAVAAGLLCALVAFVPVILFAPPAWAAIVLVGGGLFVGGFLTAHLTAEDGCAICHAGVVGLTFYTVVAGLAATTYLAPGDPPTSTLIAAAATDVRVVAGVGISGLVVTAIGGRLGARDADETAQTKS